MKNRILYTQHGKKGIYQSKALPPVTMAVTMDALKLPATREKWKADKILNLLPEAEALAVWKEQA